jgi:hypothetical protein
MSMRSTQWLMTRRREHLPQEYTSSSPNVTSIGDDFAQPLPPAAAFFWGIVMAERLGE